MRARYDGTCHLCGYPFWAGDPIRRWEIHWVDEKCFHKAAEELKRGSRGLAKGHKSETSTYRRKAKRA